MAAKTKEPDVKLALNDYISRDMVSDFSKLPIEGRMSILQKTPKTFIKERDLAGKKIKYVEHTYSRKALNFVFNFNYSCVIVSKEYTEHKVNGKDVVDAECELLFTFQLPSGAIIRSVVSSHRQYPNAALTKTDAMKAAISKAYTKVAQTFGMATEEEYVPQAEVEEPKEEKSTVKEVTEKSFASDTPLPY